MSPVWAAQWVGVQLFPSAVLPRCGLRCWSELSGRGRNPGWKINVEGQIAYEDNIKRLPCSTWGHSTFGDKSQCVQFPLQLFFFGIAFSFKKKKIQPCLDCMVNDL